MRWLFLLSLAVTLASAKIFNKCELAKYLEKQTILPMKITGKSSSNQRMTEDQVETWVCIAFKESTYNTKSLNDDKNIDGSKDYGLFQLNNKFWCKDGSTGSNGCNTDCAAFQDDDITDDLACAKQVFQEQGLNAWTTYDPEKPHGICHKPCVGEDCNLFGKLDECSGKENGETGAVKEEEKIPNDAKKDKGVCVFPKSCAKDNGYEDVCYSCNKTECASTTFKDLVVLKREEVNCCDEIPRRKRQASHYFHAGYGNQGFKSGYGNLGFQSGFGNIGHPKLDPLFIGCDDPDFISDGCDRNEIQMENDNKCYGVLTNGPCGIEGIVLVDKTTKKGHCVPRLCGPDRIFLASTQQCHDPREPGLCERSDHILYTNMYGEPVCGCRSGFYEKDSKCRQILTETDICDKGQVFWFESFREAPKCLPDPCKGDNINRPPNQLPFAPDKDGICYPIASQPLGMCNRDQFYFLDMEKLEGYCERLDDAGFIIYTPEEFVEAKQLFGPFIPKGSSQASLNALEPPASTSLLSWKPVIPVHNVIVPPPLKFTVNVLPHYSPVHNMMIPTGYSGYGINHLKGVITGYSGVPVEAAVESARKIRESPPIQVAHPYKSHHRQARWAYEQYQYLIAQPIIAPNTFGTQLNNCNPGAYVLDHNVKCNHRVKRSTFAVGPPQLPIPVNIPAQEQYTCQVQKWNQHHECGGAIIQLGGR